MKSKKLTTKEAVATVLGKAGGGPLGMPEIIKLAVPMTALAGKTPGQLVYSTVYSEAKKPDGLFVKLGRGQIALRDGKRNPTAKAAPKAKAAAK
jgi:HB1, ASXL, restriction endonuclease HTH domain